MVPIGTAESEKQTHGSEAQRNESSSSQISTANTAACGQRQRSLEFKYVSPLFQNHTATL